MTPVITSGTGGLPGTLTIGALTSPLSIKPRSASRAPPEPVGFGAAAGMPPKAALEPTATMRAAPRAAVRTRSNPLFPRSRKRTTLAQRNATVDNQHVLAVVAADCAVTRRFSRGPCGGLQHVVVVERKLVEDQPFERRFERSQDGFAAPVHSWTEIQITLGRGEVVSVCAMADAALGGNAKSDAIYEQ